MKAELLVNGTLLVSAENETEGYALRRWWENFDQAFNKTDGEDSVVAVDWKSFKAKSGAT